MSILVTGGAGYIGSHTCIELLNSSKDVIVIDNFSNSKPECLKRVKKITGKEFSSYDCDVTNREQLRKIFADENIEAVINFAGLKAVGESVQKPLDYYHNNVTGTINILSVMKEFKVKSFIFSSSATVYGEKNPIPYVESFSIGNCTNPYGQTKLMIEQILKDAYIADNSLNITVLRYFNPIGAHESGLIGEDPNGVPNNLMPYITRVAIGKLEKVNVFGGDYDTKDGTGVRDYIHVSDLARGHLMALDNFEGYKIFNLGTGEGYSVLDVISAFEKASGKKIPYEIVGRRDGDLPIYYANAEKAKKELGFETNFSLLKMCEDSWKWQSLNPNGM